MALFAEYHNDTQLVPYAKTVHEHRAPTDQSVALLREMESKAKDNVIQAIPMEFNGLKCTIVSYRSPYNYTEEILIKYNINGIENICQVKIPWLSYTDHPQLETILKEIHKQFSEDLARTILFGLGGELLPVVQKLGVR